MMMEGCNLSAQAYLAVGRQLFEDLVTLGVIQFNEEVYAKGLICIYEMTSKPYWARKNQTLYKLTKNVGIKLILWL